MPRIRCPFPDCQYQTTDAEAAVVAAQLNIHALTHQIATQGDVGFEQRQARSMERPRIRRGCTPEEWLIFIRKWELFKRGTDLPESLIPDQLFQCCEGELETDLFTHFEDTPVGNEDMILNALQLLAVKDIAAGARKANVFCIWQGHNRHVELFIRVVNAAARKCSFTTTCPKDGCGQIVDYTDDIVKHLIIAGAADGRIRREVLSLPELDSISLEETIKLVEALEITAPAKIPCFCGKCPQPSKTALDHHIFDQNNGWTVKQCRALPTVVIKVGVSRFGHDQNVPFPEGSDVCVRAVTDSGMAVSLMSRKTFLECGFTMDLMKPVHMRLAAANDGEINLLGAVFLRLSAITYQGDHIETMEMVYVTDSVANRFLLSRHAMEQLLIIRPDFPRIGEAALTVPSDPALGCKSRQSACVCPERVSSVGHPAEKVRMAVEIKHYLLRLSLLYLFISTRPTH